jgi:hypothetical protein
MFKLIIECKSIESGKENIIQIQSEFTKYYLNVMDIEYDITNQIEPIFEFNFSNDNRSTANINFKSGEMLSNIPFNCRAIK